ncbi:GNAT family N-acetyltransferase [Oscillospiraceae bacterium HV4-5-C5C]|nr:GNAT family N-acetyltransferase [Oscillospiraceae bacterium HV4-5-C5C]
MHIRTDKNHIDWQQVADLLAGFGLSHNNAQLQQQAFENSYAVAFVYDGPVLVGCARALSDGVCQAAIYNVAVNEAYHGRQLGRRLIEALLEQVPNCTVILYTHPQTIEFYERLGFRRQKTGFVRLADAAEKQDWMEETGFLLPEHYRFADNSYEKRPFGSYRAGEQKTDLPPEVQTSATV